MAKRKPLIERLIEEKQWIMDRYLRLFNFMHSDEFYAVPDEERNRLVRQSQVMHVYLSTIEERIQYARCHNTSPVYVEDLVGRTIVAGGKCDECLQEYNENCKKLILAGGQHICVK